MKIFTYKLRAVILRTAGALLLLHLSGCNQPKDVDGNSPEDAARRFVEFGRAKNYEAAAACWHDGDIANIEANRTTSFAKYCEYYECDSYQIEADGIDKGFYWIRFVGWKDGQKKAQLLFFADPSKEKDGRWRMTEDRWITDSAR